MPLTLNLLYLALIFIAFYVNVDQFLGCTDDDECALDLHHCDPVNADCKNTNGSYECVCKIGFEGDGFDCHVSFF